MTRGYGVVGQARWAAWIKKNSLQGSTQPYLDDQVMDLITFIEPVYTQRVSGSASWDPVTYAWMEHRRS